MHVRAPLHVHVDYYYYYYYYLIHGGLAYGRHGQLGHQADPRPQAPPFGAWMRKAICVSDPTVVLFTF